MVSASEWVTHPVDAFRVASPWSDDRLPARHDTSHVMSCDDCGKHFLDRGWLDKHLADAHMPGEPRDIEDDLAPMGGRQPALWQTLARKVRDRIASGTYKPGDEVRIKEFFTEFAVWNVQRAFRMLTEHGVLRRTGTVRHTRYWVPEPGADAE